MAVNGIPLSFAELDNSNITTETLIEWIIPFHLIEQYADYLNSSRRTSIDENTDLQLFAKTVRYSL